MSKPPAQCGHGCGASSDVQLLILSTAFLPAPQSVPRPAMGGQCPPPFPLCSQGDVEAQRG